MVGKLDDHASPVRYYGHHGPKAAKMRRQHIHFHALDATHVHLSMRVKRVG